MDIKDLQRNWNEFGKTDPLWAILTLPNKKNNKWQLDEFFLTGEREIETVLQYVQQNLNTQISFQNALDFGCGVGRLSQALAKYFDEVHGVDIASSMIEKANQYNKYSNKCHYHLNNTDSLEFFEDQSFNFIYTSITLQHMKTEYSKKYIEEFFRVLAPEGILVFQIPSKRTDKTLSLYKIKSVLQKLPLYEQIIPVYYRIKYNNKAIMEMYGIPKEEVLNLIKNNGGKLLDFKPDSTIEFWESYQYICAKK